VGSALQSIVSGSAESTSGIAIANALVDTQHGIDLTNPSMGVDALASGGSSTVISTSSLTATSTAQTVYGTRGVAAKFDFGPGGVSTTRKLGHRVRGPERRGDV
jgi:hypothetical protein